MVDEQDSKAGDEQCSTTDMSNVAQDDVYYSTVKDLSSKNHVVRNAKKRAEFDPVKNEYLVPFDKLPEEAENSKLTMETTYVKLQVRKNDSITEQETCQAAQNKDLTIVETNLGVRPGGKEFTLELGGPSEANDSPISSNCGRHLEVNVCQSCILTSSLYAGESKFFISLPKTSNSNCLRFFFSCFSVFQRSAYELPPQPEILCETSMYSMKQERDSKAGDESCLTTAVSNHEVTQEDADYSTARDISSKTHVVTNAVKRANFYPGENDYLVPVDRLPEEAEYTNLTMDTTHGQLTVGKGYSSPEQEASEVVQNQDLTAADKNLGVRPVGSDYTLELAGTSEANDSLIFSTLRDTLGSECRSVQHTHFFTLCRLKAGPIEAILVTFRRRAFNINCDRHKRFPQNERRRADLQNFASDF